MPSQTRAYKEITFQQLRSFCETARLGSLAAAAAALQLSNPTVWKQVHALERFIGARLIEPYGRGCRLTEAGRRLVTLAAPPVASIGSLKRLFQESQAQAEVQLTVVATPRILVDDLPDCVVEFERRYPPARLTLKEARSEEIASVVESGEADLGLSVEKLPSGESNPWLEFEPCYELDIVLITPKDHPLARRRQVRPGDLSAYPLVNAPTAWLLQPVVAATLDKLGLYRTQPRRVEAFYTAVIRRYVALGFGIGLVAGLPSRRPRSDLHERSMSSYFGRVSVYLVKRRGAMELELARAFADTVRPLLNQQPGKRGRKRTPAIIPRLQ